MKNTTGNGIDQQIEEATEYSTLTQEKLEQTIKDIPDNSIMFATVRKVFKDRIVTAIQYLGWLRKTYPNEQIYKLTDDICRELQWILTDKATNVEEYRDICKIPIENTINCLDNLISEINDNVSKLKELINNK